MLAGGFNFFQKKTPQPGEMIQFDQYVSDRWNHQLEFGVFEVRYMLGMPTEGPVYNIYNNLD